jgi:4-amino-4-deoxy-L-arabinose transferase-like glycosyltransferase
VKSKFLWAALWAAMYVSAIIWRAQNLDAFGLSNDEGVYLMWGRLAAEGYALYREIYAVQPPLFLESLALAFRFFGSTIAVGRWTMLAGFCLLAPILSWLAYRGSRWPGAITALLLVSISPLIFSLSRLAMAEVPATALAATTLALLTVYTNTGQRGWLFMAGFVLGLSFIFKPLQPYVAVVGMVMLVLYRSPDRLRPSPTLAHLARLVSAQKPWKSLLADLIIFGSAVIVPVAMIFVLYDAAALYDQVVAFRADLRAAIPGSWGETWEFFKLFVIGHWGFWLLAVAGIILNEWVRGAPTPVAQTLSFIATTWLLVGSVLLVWHTPLFAHHFVVLLPPLILLGADFVGRVVWLSQTGTGPRLARLSAILIIGLALLNLPAMARANQQTASVVTGGRAQQALALLKAVTLPADFVMGDSQLLIFMADRRTPPALGDLALVGIKAGRQTSDRLIQITKDQQSPAVVRWSLRLPWLPDYVNWVEQNYLARREWDNDHIIHFVPRVGSEQLLPNQRQVKLENGFAFRGYQLLTKKVVPGDEVELKLFWQVDVVPEVDYTVFTQLLDANGVFVTGFDSQPLGGYFPTSQWPANEIVTDVIRLPVPDTLAPGQYTLITGLYRLNTLERLTVLEDNRDFIVVTEITVQ